MTDRSDEGDTLSADESATLSVDDGAIRAEYDWTDTLASTAVVETVAVACDCEPMDLDPLYEVIDPDALNAVVSSGDDPAAGGTTVTFEVADRSVAVHDGGAVVVRPAESGLDGVRE